MVLNRRAVGKNKKLGKVRYPLAVLPFSCWSSMCAYVVHLLREYEFLRVRGCRVPSFACLCGWLNGERVGRVCAACTVSVFFSLVVRVFVNHARCSVRAFVDVCVSCSDVSCVREQKKKGGSRKATDPFAKKEWYDVKAPSSFTIRDIGKTVVNKTAGQSKPQSLCVRACAVCACLHSVCRACVARGRITHESLMTHTFRSAEIARDGLIGRVFEASLGDLKQQAEDEAFRKFSFK